MAINSLNNRLDQLTGTPEQQQIPLLPEAEEQAPLDAPADVLAEPQQPEYEPVAGVFSLMRKGVKAAVKKGSVPERPILPKDVESGKVGPYAVIREEAPKADQILQDAPKAPASGKPSPTQAQKDAGVQETVFNLDNISDVDGVRQFIEATARNYGADKITKISYKEVAEKAAEDGYDERFLARILDPNVQTMASPAEAYKMLLSITDAGKRAFDLGEAVKAAKASGTLSADLASQFSQAVALEGALLKAAKGRQADIARTLGIFSQARRSTVNRGAQLDAIMTEAGGIDNAFEVAKRYTALDSRAARAAYAEAGYSNDIKGWASRFVDAGYTTWINGLLSSPVTHAKNIVGNAFFGAYQIPERAVASAFGKARNAVFGGEEAIALDEVYAQAVGFMQGMREGAGIAGKAFVKNEPTDAFAKIESTRNGRDPFSLDFGSSTTGKAMSGALDYWGKFVTLPGRALMAEDEFFKAVGYRMELNALATREATREYKRLVQAGVPDGDAAKQAAALQTKLLAEPSAEIDEAARAAARTVTFTRELEPNLQKLQTAVNNPLLKMFFPFVRTPTNIAMEAMSRTPGMNLISPRFWADYSAGGVRRDMAMARVTLGGAVLYGAGTYALEGKLTGYGPMRTEDKKAMEGTGWQQFSFVFNKGEMPYEMIEKFRSITSVTEGSDKIYVSYAGIEPLSTLLAIASTSGEYSMVTAGEAEMDKLAIGGTMGLYQYLSDQPMLQGFSELEKIFTSGAKDAPTYLYNMMAQVSKQATSFAIGGSPAGAHSSLVAAVERVVKPEKSLVMEATSSEEIGPVSGAAKGFWEAVGTYCSRNPLCSDSLPNQLDPVTGETKRISRANWADTFNPFRTSDGKVSPAYAALVEYGVPAPKVDKKIKGIELTDLQYNRLIELATADGGLEQDIASLAESGTFARLAARDLAAAQEMLGKVMSDAYKIAREQLVAEDRDLADAIRDLQDRQRDDGKFKR